MSNAPSPASPVTESEVKSFVESINAKFPNNYRTWLYEKGRRYYRVYTMQKSIGQPGKFDEVSRSAYAFIDSTDGMFLKAAGWKSPANGSRGNIRDGSANKWIGEYGVNPAR